LLIALLVLASFTSLFIGVRFSAIDAPGLFALPQQGVPSDPTTPAIMIFAAVPWVLAAGLLGPLAAGAVGLVSGSFTALWQTLPVHYRNRITGDPVQRRAQPYRTPVFRLLRHPLASAFLAALFYPFLHLAITPFITRGLLVTRLDYALTNLRSTSLAVATELLIAGLIAELVVVLLPAIWSKPEKLEPSPAERSLRTRFIVSLAPLAIILVLTLMVGLAIAGQAQTMLESQMARPVSFQECRFPGGRKTWPYSCRIRACSRRITDRKKHWRRTLRCSLLQQAYLAR
jgi:hypothetical protein